MMQLRRVRGVSQKTTKGSSEPHGRGVRKLPTSKLPTCQGLPNPHGSKCLLIRSRKITITIPGIETTYTQYLGTLEGASKVGLSSFHSQACEQPATSEAALVMATEHRPGCHSTLCRYWEFVRTEIDCVEFSSLHS